MQQATIPISSSAEIRLSKSLSFSRLTVLRNFLNICSATFSQGWLFTPPKEGLVAFFLYVLISLLALWVSAQ